MKKNTILTLVSMLLISYLLFIIYISKYGQDKLSESRKREFDLTVQNKIITLNYLLNNAKESIEILSQDNSFKVFFTNKALGMSMLYGLKANLIKSQKKIDSFYEDKKIANDYLFNTISIVQDNKEIITNNTINLNSKILKEVEKLKKKTLIKPIIENNILNIYILKNIYNKDTIMATIISKLNFQNILNKINFKDDNTNNFISFKNKIIDIKTLNVIANDKKEFTNKTSFNIIDNISLLVDKNINKEEVLTSKKFLIGLALLTLFIVIGMIYLLRLNSRNIRLQTQMAFTREYNENLENEINKKTQDLKNALLKQEELNNVLEKTNETLDQKVKEQIEKLRQKDIQYIEQGKMAAMGEMIGNIAHQWRQPLSAISSSASSLKLFSQMGILKNNELEKTCEDIVSKSIYLSKTIETFRNFIKDKKELKAVNINKTVDIVFQIIGSTLKNHLIEVNKNLPKEDIYIVMIGGELEQVLINVLNNAKDILIEKQIKEPCINLELYSKNNILTITIEDNAGGVPQDILPKIFEPYFTTKHQSQGTGLGLHMSYKIITESFKGKFYVKNTKLGAKFFIEIPIK